MKKTQLVAYYGILAALAAVLSYIDRLIPLPVPIPGVKLGLANVVVLMALYIMGGKHAAGISLIRLLLAAAMFSGVAGFLYSAAGAALSLGAMAAVKKIPSVGVCGVSIAGGIFHNIGQIAAACLVVKNIGLMAYLPALLISGTITGIATGTAAAACIPHIAHINKESSAPHS